MGNKTKYSRVLFKISGESLKGHNSIIDFDNALKIAEKIKECQELGVKIGIVVGGGNIWRGRDSREMDGVVADQIGMLATIQNMLALENALQRVGAIPRGMTAIPMDKLAEGCCQKRMMAHLQNNKIVIFGAGTGNPFSSTDYAAALRAAEMDADVLLKFTTVDGVYDKDPNKHDDAKKINEITFDEVIKQGLGVMDQTAFTLCRENNIPIGILNIYPLSNIVDAVQKEKTIGTLISNR